MKFKKTRGNIYTPNYIVRNVLDSVRYSEKNILKKHIIDNSSGKGAFLIEIVKRYCDTYINEKKTLDGLKEELETYIHGIEIDYESYLTSLSLLNEMVEEYNIGEVNWDIVYGDTLENNKYEGKMDFVVGNPPYVRTKNLDDHKDKVKTMRFTKNGMSDLYIAFLDIGLGMLNETGKLSYIIPNSIFNNASGKVFREYVIKNKLLVGILDFEHFQAFNAITYSTIMVFDKENKDEKAKYSTFNKVTERDTLVDVLDYQDFFFNGNFYFQEKQSLKKTKAVFENQKQSGLRVKNGFATLGDSIFIKDENGFDENDFIIPVKKASTGEEKVCIFPYENGKVVSESVLKENPYIYNYLYKNKEALTSRSLTPRQKWYGFGREQGIKDVYKRKVSINNLIRYKHDLKIDKIPEGTGVYSGLYIVGMEDSEKIIEALYNDEFVKFVKTLSKYKSGGYYSFSSKDVKAYLDYWFLK